MSKFKIKYYYKSTFKNGSANDWDNIKVDEVDLDLPENATQIEICELWQKTNGLERVTFVSAELVIDHVLATHWPTYILDAIKTGLESPTPYRVIPYKNNRGIKKIEFI